jgi:hypothetical protein
MNVIKLMDHPDLNRQEQLMAFIFKLGMLERSQLATLMATTEINIKQLIHNIRHQEISSEKQEKDKWINSVRGKKRESKRLYKLGPKGLQLAAKALYYTGSYEELDTAQREHFRGLNEILVRLIRAIDRQETIQYAEWYNTKDSFQELIRIWEWYRQKQWLDDPKLRKEDIRKMARPDALLILNNQRAWVEFDTGSEDTPQLEDKYKRWAYSLVKFNIQDPVVWITTKESRTKKLSSLWEYRKSMLNMKYYPSMYFFTAGEDTDFFLSMLQSTKNQVSP